MLPNILSVGRLGQRISKGGGEISNVVVFKKILKNWPSWVHFQTTFCEKGGGEGPPPPPPRTAYARGIGLVQVILVLSFFHFCLKLSFVKSNRIILTETHVHKIPPPSQKFDQYINNCYYLYPLVSKHDYITLMPIEYCILLLLSMVVLFRKGQ